MTHKGDKSLIKIWNKETIFKVISLHTLLLCRLFERLYKFELCTKAIKKKQLVYCSLRFFWSQAGMKIKLKHVL